ncbi:AzlC family ABC transporter permease [Alphaproteobacteria bacterium]|nr:AzlC family ABC transporter permease [Alphaproteobacteria bacterium]
MHNEAITSSRDEFWLGVRDELPMMLGVVPFGLVFGVLGVSSGLTPLQTILMSSILFGGASQVVFVQLWASNIPSLVIAGSVSVINLRHALYSASMASYLRPLSIWWRVVLGYLLTDEAYAISIRRFTNMPKSPNQHFHLLGAGLTLWISWQCATITGVLAGAKIPPEWSLSFAIPLTFIAIVAPAIKSRADLVACITAGTIAIIGQDLPVKSWIILAAFGGIASGWGVKTLIQRKHKHDAGRQL